MLMVSDLIELAKGMGTPDKLAARAPLRFGERSARMPVVVWNVCRHCNMTCPHCYAAAGPAASERDLSTAEAMAVIDSMADAGIKVVIFSGGEPLLRHDLLELIVHATGRGISAQLSTNGVLIDDAKADALAGAGIRYVGVSIDGIQAFNDSYRGLAHGFDLAIRGLRAAKAAGMRTGMRMTVTQRNADHLGPLVNRAWEIGVQRFYVSHLVYAGRGRSMVGDDLAPEASRALLHGLFGIADRLLEGRVPLRIVTGGNDSDGPLLLLWARDRYGEEASQPVEDLLRMRGGNSAGEGVLCIDHVGKVHPDQFWRGATLGDVRAQPFAEILEHPLRTTLAEREKHLEGSCRSCAFVALCRGSHRERAISHHGSIWADDPACVVPAEKRGTSAAGPAPIDAVPVKAAGGRR